MSNKTNLKFNEINILNVLIEEKRNLLINLEFIKKLINFLEDEISYLIILNELSWQNHEYIQEINYLKNEKI